MRFLRSTCNFDFGKFPVSCLKSSVLFIQLCLKFAVFGGELINSVSRLS